MGAVKWLVDGLIKGLTWLGGYIDKGGDILAEQFGGVFMVAAMIGVFITMAGGKKLGTKVSSLSLVLYILLKVFL